MKRFVPKKALVKKLVAKKSAPKKALAKKIATSGSYIGTYLVCAAHKMRYPRGESCPRCI